MALELSKMSLADLKRLRYQVAICNSTPYQQRRLNQINEVIKSKEETDYV